MLTNVMTGVIREWSRTVPGSTVRINNTEYVLVVTQKILTDGLTISTEGIK